MVDVVVQALIERILDGVLGPAFPVSEEDVRDSCHVSRATARSAIAELTTRRYLTKEPNRAARVTGLTPDGIEDLFRVRRPIEIEAVRLIMAPNKPATLDPDIDETIDELERSSAAPPHIQIPMNLRFHQLIVGSANSVWLSTLFASLEPGLHLALSQSRRSIDPREVARQHRLLVDSIRDSNFDATKQLFSDHLRDSGRQVAALIP